MAEINKPKPQLQIVQSDLPRLVKTAYLQAPTTIHGFMQAATTLTESQMPGVVMQLDKEYLWLFKGQEVAVIPTTNIKVCLFK